MNEDVTVVFHGFLGLPNLEKLKLVEAINEYFDSMEREALRARHDVEFAKLKFSEVGTVCKCCGR